MTGGLIGLISGDMSPIVSVRTGPGANDVGGLVGNSQVGVANCRYEGLASGRHSDVVVLIGENHGSVFRCGAVLGSSQNITGATT
jgi:hypothetical protein